MIVFIINTATTFLRKVKRIIGERFDVGAFIYKFWYKI